MILGYPIQVHIGMTGTFHGQKYNVVGHALLGETEYGRIYYWNEYYLETDGEQYLTTLVYEEANLGGEWRWFTMYDPENPLTAADAATKRVGNIVNLDGANLRVSFVNESSVYQSEGRTPEGVKPGARAKYFNAETGGKLQVISWTGEEVECFRGMDLTPGMVASAFNIRTADLVKYPVLSGTSSNDNLAKMAKWAMVGIFLVFILVSEFGRSASTPPAVVQYDIPAPALKVGDSGTLNGVNYRIDGQAKVEIDEMGRVMTRHEYFLRAADGSDALLICGSKMGAQDWMLFTPLPSFSFGLNPRQAGAVRLGQMVTVDGLTVRVEELFRSTVIKSENANEPDSSTGDVRYGFSGKGADGYLLARWNENGITFRQGTPLHQQDVLAAFNSPAAK